MSLGSLIRPELIFPDLPGSDRPSVLQALAQRMAEQGAVRDADTLYRKLEEREALGSTGIGSAVAIPHCKMAGLDRVVVAIGLCRRGVDFGADDDKPVKVLFAVVSPEDNPAGHLQSLAAISKWIKANNHLPRMLKLRAADELYDFLQQESA